MRRSLRVLVVCESLLPTLASAADRPVGGKFLRLSAPGGDPDARVLTYRAVPDPQIAVPFGPTTGASLAVFSSNQPGGCRIDVALPAANWSPLGGDPAKGWRYVDDSGAAAGVRKIVVKPGGAGGKITIKARGASLPCDVPSLNSTHWICVLGPIPPPLLMRGSILPLRSRKRATVCDPGDKEDYRKNC